MKIGPLARTTFERVHLYGGVAEVEQRLLAESFVVVEDDEGFVGLLAAEDLVRSPRVLIADCLKPLPNASYDDDLRVVLDRMRDEGVKALPVFRDSTFFGVCVRSDLADFLECQRVELEDELRRSEVRYREIVETSNEGVWILDAVGRTTFASAQAASSVGSSVDALIGRPLADFVVEDDQKTLASALEVVLSGRAHRTQLRLNGGEEPRWFLGSMTPRRADDRVVGVIAMLADMTETKRLEETVRRAQKMEAIGTLAAGIAHDINNVLTPVLVHAELLALAAESEVAADHAGRIVDAVTRISDVTRRLLTLSRQRPQKPQPIDLDAVVREGMQLLRASLPTTISVRVVYGSKPAVVTADSTLVHQILLNLCTNAHHAMRAQGGVLEVEVDRRDVLPSDLANLDAPAPGRYARLIVRDTGVGMSPEIRERLFEPYFTTREKGEGSGLGLAVVHGIVASFGGFVTVESAPGKGSAFAVWLPLSEGFSLEPSREPALATGGTERVLVVDDESRIVEACEQTLSSRGYRVSTTKDSRHALELLRTDPRAFDVLVTDEVMPHLRGRDLARAARTLRPDLRVLLMSGNGFGRAEAGGVVDDVLIKPFSAGDLLDKVRKLLDTGARDAIAR